jgi:hypothetical protein
MFLKCHPRSKDGKEHRYWSVVENRIYDPSLRVDRSSKAWPCGILEMRNLM